MKKNKLFEGVIFDYAIIYAFIKKLTTPFVKTDAFKYGIIDKDGNILRKRNTLKTEKEKAAFTIFDVFIFNLKKILEKLPGGKSLLSSYIAALYLIKESNNINLNDDNIILEFGLFLNMLGEEDIKMIVEEYKKFTKAEVKDIGDSLGVDWNKIDFHQFQMGLEVEKEHDKDPATDVVNSVQDLGKIALAHLDEIPDYYTRLKKMENEDAPANVSGSGAVAGLVGDPPVYINRRKKLRHF